MIKKFLDLTQLQLRAVLDPFLLHERVILFVQINGFNQFSRLAMVKTALFAQVHDLEGLQHLG